jgi:hypothetical protein
MGAAARAAISAVQSTQLTGRLPCVRGAELKTHPGMARCLDLKDVKARNQLLLASYTPTPMEYLTNKLIINS